jgi:purine-nucleoside phosphorylase
MNRTTESDCVANAAETIRRRWPAPAASAVILGTGLGELADELTGATVLDYADIPGFSRVTAQAHRGRLVCGDLAGTPVMMLQGRCHLYEGYQLAELTRPVRVLAALGVRRIVVTNAAGGLNTNFEVGDVMLIDDHIHLQGRVGAKGVDQARPDHPAAGAGGPATHSARRARLYDQELARVAETTARRADFPLRRGVYVAVTGPSYETRAEYRAFRRLGGDAVGMSTVPEVLAATACGLSVAGLSTITNVAVPDAPRVVSSHEVVDVARLARPRVGALVLGLVAAKHEARSTKHEIRNEFK